MIRGLYTGASAMAARTHEMDVISNNLANVNTTGYKKDEAIYKAFPEMLLRRINDDGVRTFPLGSYDKRPVIFKLGTGVEINEVYTYKSQASLKATENPLDFALEGKGYFVVQTPQGERFTRNGNWVIDKENRLVTKAGLPVLGEKGPIYIQHHNFTVNDLGEIYVNKALTDPQDRPVQMLENGFEEVEFLDTLKIMEFPFERYLKKIGTSQFEKTQESGEPVLVSGNGLKVKQGFLELSNVNAIKEMVKMIEVHRAYEASQKTIAGHDQTLDRLINDMGRV